MADHRQRPRGTRKPKVIMKKPRSDSKLMNIDDDQREQLINWMLSGLPYHKIKTMLKDQFTISTSFGALSNFYEKIVTPALIARRQRAVTTADQIAREASQTPGKFDAATIDALKQRALEMSISPGVEPRDVKQIFSLVLKARDQDLAERQLEQKIREYEQKITATRDAMTRAVAKGGITKKTLGEIERAMNLL